jgi:hypothetical protein
MNYVINIGFPPHCVMVDGKDMDHLQSTKPLKRCISSSFFKCRFRDSVGFCGHHSGFHTELDIHTLFHNVTHFVVCQPLSSCETATSSSREFYDGQCMHSSLYWLLHIVFLRLSQVGFSYFHLWISEWLDINHHLVDILSNCLFFFSLNSLANLPSEHVYFLGK